MCFLALFPEREKVEEGVGILESQCTFVWGENRRKNFLTSNPVEALIPFNEEHQGLFQTSSSFGVGVGEDRVWGKGWGYLQERVLSSRFLLVDCYG